MTDEPSFRFVQREYAVNHNFAALTMFGAALGLFWGETS
jgi:hypothetical protein